MRKSCLTSLVFLLAGSSWGLGQMPETLPPAPAGNLAVAPASAEGPEKTPPSETVPMPRLVPPGGPAPLDVPPHEVPALHVQGPTTISYIQGEADYNLWFFPDRRARNALAASSLSNLSSVQESGIGDLPFSRRELSGAAFGLSAWEAELNPWVPGGIIPVMGFEAKLFFTQQRSLSTVAERTPALFRPFFDLNDNIQSAVLVAAPGVAAGSLQATAKGSLWGAEANLRRNVYFETPGTLCSVEVLGGLRYVRLDSSIDFNRNSLFSTTIPDTSDFAFLRGSRLIEQEAFLTHNSFYGAQVGAAGHLYINGATVTGTVKVALGSTTEDINITGNQQQVRPDGTVTNRPGALLALPSNIGRHSQSRFTFIPEAGVDVAFPVCDWLTLSLGFKALHWNRLVLAGDQIDRAIDITQIPNFPVPPGTVATGLNRPAVFFNQTDLWLLATNVGVELRW